MRQTRHIMGMPVHVEIIGTSIPQSVYESVFALLVTIDEQFSTYKDSSEISKINRGEILPAEYSRLMQEIFAKAEVTKQETNGYFDIRTPDGTIDPSGIVKGWAIHEAAELIRTNGYKDFYIEIAGDIQSSGRNADGEEWCIGIRNPFVPEEIVRVIYPHGSGVATSGTYERGAHLYDPHTQSRDLPGDLVSVTVLGPTIYDADRFATAAFVMGKEKGMHFLAQLPGYEAYAIDAQKQALYTSGFSRYLTP